MPAHACPVPISLMPMVGSFLVIGRLPLPGLARHVRQQFCGGCRSVKHLLHMLFRAAHWLLHEEPLNWAIAQLKRDRVPVDSKNLIFELLQALPTKVGARI